MVREGDEVQSAKAVVLLCTQDRPAGRSYVEALEEATIPVEWVRTHSELQMRLGRMDLPRPALVMVLPSRHMPMLPRELANMMSRLAPDGAGVSSVSAAQVSRSALEESLNSYCSMRALSRRQRQVLELYLIGNNDKEIAESFRCSAATVYEHWRRMARKANGAHKSDAINDFHRFLGGRSANEIVPSWPASPRQSNLR
jgi:DNA-binding CsgD family transcriptional regulator